MIERSLAVISNQNKRGGLALRNDLRNSFRLERALEKRSLTIKRKLVEDRDRTLKGLLLRSRQEKKDKKGDVGGALGILGGGALGRRFFGRGGQGGLLRGLPKVPKSPSSLLRMQRGTSALSRVGRVGRLGRIGPLAVVGTGLDFVGRRAQGQTNLQAGLGAGGGLAGALAGAKYGAILGTAVGGPIGTVIGGIGGSIIGGLAGGRLADLFSGADRRRKFEEQRVEIATQKTLFSSALDDLDRVLDRLEKTPLILKKDDDGIPRRDSPFAFFGLIRTPKPPKLKFIDRPIVKDIGYTAAFTGLLFLSVLAIGSSPGTPEDAGLILLLRQTVQKSPFLMKIAKNIIKFPKPTPKPEFLKPGVDIPNISPKGIRLRIGDDLFRKLFPNIKFKPKGSPPKKIKKIKPDIKKIEEKVLEDLLKREKFLQEQLKKLTNSKTIDEAKRKAIQKFYEELRVITEKLQGKRIPKRYVPNSEPFVRPSTNTNNLRVEAPTNDDDNFIALAPTNNIFLMNQEESNQSTPITEGSDTFLINRGSVSAYDVAINMAQIELLQTA